MKKRIMMFAFAAMGMAAALSIAGCNNSKQTTQQLVTPKESIQEAEDKSKDGSGNGKESGEVTKAESTVNPDKKTGIAEQVQAPERYVAAFSDVNQAVHVHADAKVVIPMAAGFKLYKVTGRPFAQEDYDTVSHVLLQDASLWNRDYEMLKVSNGYIRSEIAERIQMLEEEQEAIEEEQEAIEEEQEAIEEEQEAIEEEQEAIKGNQATIKGEAVLTEAKEKNYRKLIAQLQEMVKETPAEAPIVEVEAIVPYVKAEEKREEVREAVAEDIYAANQLDGNATVNGEDYIVSLDNNWQDYNAFVLFSVRSRERGIGDCWVNLAQEEMPTSLSKEKIKEEAVLLMNEMGFTDFAPAGEEYFQKFIADEKKNGEVEKGNIGYGIHFTRVIEGIPVTYTHEFGNTYLEKEDTVWPYEKMSLVFDEKGFTDFTWWNPYEIEKQSDEYVFLMPFSDIRDIFEEMILKKNEWIAENGDVTRQIEIDEVRLGYMRVKDQTGVGVGTMIPVWDFFGSETTVYADAGETSVNRGPYESCLTINAMDGTVIDRGIGY